MRSRRLFAGAIGIALLALVVWAQDLSLAALLDATARVGATGILAIVAFHLLPLTVDAVAWRVLIAPPDRPWLRHAILSRWIGESVTALAPVAQIGGEFVRVRVAARLGLAAPIAGASVLVDVTLGVLTQIVYSLAGVAALLALVGAGHPLARALAVGLALVALGVAFFIVLQRGALFGRVALIVAPLMGRARADTLAARAGAVDDALAAIYARRWAVLESTAWRLAGWIIGAGEFWLALWLLGRPVGILEAVMLESLVQAARNAAFMVPGGLGVQEAALVMLGRLIGLDGDAMIALSLLKRAREIILGLPGVWAWQRLEFRG